MKHVCPFCDHTVGSKGQRVCTEPLESLNRGCRAGQIQMRICNECKLDTAKDWLAQLQRLNNPPPAPVVLNRKKVEYV